MTSYKTLTQAGLCEGYGGLTMAIRAVLGAQLVWYAEHEPATRQNPRPAQAASRLLAHHHPGLLNLGDLTIADWEKAEHVDILTGGWPCQPWSLAGQRNGAEDDRAIWPYVADAVRALRPRLVFLENVASIAAAGELARAVGDLAALGYVGSFRCVRASDVGAPHRRERIFILARPVEDSEDERRAAPWDQGAQPRTDAASVGASDFAAADTEDIGHERTGTARRRGHGPAHRGAAPAYANGHGLQGRSELDGQANEAGGATEASRRHADGRARPSDLGWASYTPAIRRWEQVLGRPAPAPTVLGRRGGQQLSPVFVEWMMGLPEGHVTAVPGLTRNEQLKLLGNGVVPQQAEAALQHLLVQARPGVAA